MEKEICHVCKKEKKPYIVIMDSNIISLMEHERAREEGSICERCDKYFAMTGEFKDATDEEFEIAGRSAWFARMVLKWWEKDGKMDDGDDDVNKRNWEGTSMLASWCRKELDKNKLEDKENA